MSSLKVILGLLAAGLALSGCMPATTYQAAPEATLKPSDKAQLAKARYAAVPPAEPFRRAIVDYHRKELAGTIVVDSDNHYLYLVQDGGKAIRYGVTVGEEALAFSGIAKVGNMAEWPKWTPTADIHKRIEGLPASVPGGVDNPLGARALYLYQGNKDTLFRIHGTNQPEYIGASISSGCIRMTNEDVIDLYSRVKQGTVVVVLDPKTGRLAVQFQDGAAGRRPRRPDAAVTDAGYSSADRRSRAPVLPALFLCGLLLARAARPRRLFRHPTFQRRARLRDSHQPWQLRSWRRPAWRRPRAAALRRAARPAIAAPSAASGPTRPTGRSGNCCAVPSGRDGYGPRGSRPSPGPAPSRTACRRNAARSRAISRGTVRSVSEIVLPSANLKARTSSALARPCSESLAPTTRLRPRHSNESKLSRSETVLPRRSASGAISLRIHVGQR